MLAVEDLSTHFRAAAGDVKALDGVSLSLGEGRTLGVVGESGSGKTVLIRSIMGLLPTDKVKRSGRVLLAGRDLTQLNDRELRRVWGAEIGMVFQDPMSSLNPVRTVGAQVGVPLRRHLGMRGREARRVSVDLLRSVGIAEPERRLGQYPHELSGGMRQRVMIAIALACGPQILLADEPTTALDVTVQKQILDLLDRQRADRKMGIILVTHDLGVVAAHSDEVAVMYAGRVVEQAPTSRLFASVRMPYTEALFRAIPRLADPSRTAAAVLTGRPLDPARLPAGCSFAPRCPYARERCHHEAPPLVAQPEDPKHFVACWYPVDVKAPRSVPRARERRENSSTSPVGSAGPGVRPR